MNEETSGFPTSVLWVAIHTPEHYKYFIPFTLPPQLAQRPMQFYFFYLFRGNKNLKSPPRVNLTDESGNKEKGSYSEIDWGCV